ncbi:MAG TPA: S8 family peptidase [Bacillota bacterium]|nr:S8 family peptidase [Bacillota bacterium]
MTTGKSVKVAIIDTGVSAKHPDLRQAIRGGINILNPGSTPEDDNGHGTNVAGIIGSRGAATGLSGVAPEVELYIVKAFDSDGAANLSDIVEGLEWCLKQGIKLVNLSFGLPRDHKVLRQLVKKAAEQGMLLVCAAGNEGGSDSVMYPGKYPETICVSALAPGDKLATFSSTGPEVDFIAPGKDILTTEPRGKYALKNGTSFAAPHATGVLALLLGFSQSPLCKTNLTTAQIQDILIGSTQHLPNLTPEEQGHGLINALQSMSKLVRI